MWIISHGYCERHSPFYFTYIFCIGNNTTIVYQMRIAGNIYLVYYEYYKIGTYPMPWSSYVMMNVCDDEI